MSKRLGEVFLRSTKTDLETLYNKQASGLYRYEVEKEVKANMEFINKVLDSGEVELTGLIREILELNELVFGGNE